MGVNLGGLDSSWVMTIQIDPFGGNGEDSWYSPKREKYLKTMGPTYK